MTSWIVEDFHADNGTPELLEALQALSIPHQKAKYTPFGGTDMSQFDKGDFIYVGSINMAEEVIKQRPDLKKNFWSTFENYDCSIYLSQIGDYCLNGENYAFFPFEDLKRQKWNIYRWFGEDSHVFIRPNSGNKEFTGAAIDFQNFDHQIDRWQQFTRKNSLTLVSKPVNIVFEWRIVVAAHKEIKKVVAASLYKMKGEQNLVAGAPGDAMMLAEKVINILQPPDPMYCVDVALLNDGRYKVIEINAFSTSGHYKADKKKIIETANQVRELI